MLKHPEHLPDPLLRQFVAELGKAILRVEKEHGRVDRSRMAKRLNISRGSMYAYLNGTTLPSTDVLDRLLIELGLPACEARALLDLRDSVEIARRTHRNRQRADLLGHTVSPDLPRDIAVLHGRETELDQIVTVVSGVGEAICVISGLGGVGKTALAVRAARTAASEFPDGCLFVDLHGYSELPVMPPEHAADKLLRQLAVAPESVPPQSDRRFSMLRELLRQRRLLLVLDNVLDTAHIAPLLPTDSACAVLITSRNNLNGLDDARRVRVQPLSPTDSADLMRRLSADLTPEHTPDGQQLQAISRQCHGLPVAVRIAVAVMRSEPWPDTMAGDVVDFDMFHDGDRSLEPFFEHSVARLPPDVAAAFTTLGLHIGPDFDIDAAAAAIGVNRAVARRMLRTLVEVNLVTPRRRGRYELHDLLRTFACRRATNGYTPGELTDAVTRIVDHYLSRLDAADRLLTPHRHRLAMTRAPTETPYQYADYDVALQGLSAERDNLAAACRAALDLGLDEQCWQIAFALREFAFITHDIDLWVETHERGLAATVRAGNRYAEAVTSNNLGLALLTRGDDEAAAALYRRAHTLFEDLGDAHGEHTSLAHLAWVHFHRGELDDAYEHSIKALAFVSASDTPRNTAILLRDTALIEVALGQYRDAVPRLLEALEMFQTFALRVDEAMAYNVLGAAYHGLDALTQAHQAYSRATELARAAGSVLEEARGHEGIGSVVAAQRNWTAARRHWKHALAGYTRLRDSPGQARIRSLLETIPT